MVNELIDPTQHLHGDGRRRQSGPQSDPGKDPLDAPVENRMYSQLPLHKITLSPFVLICMSR
jgi:hypothetical protein